MEKHLKATLLLDYRDKSIQELIRMKNWDQSNEFDKILQTYNYVRDEIKFGYNVDDAIPASKVLADGYGQCNTKLILFMALLRALNIPCRVHGFSIDKELQKGALPTYLYKFAPKNIIHSWVEVYYMGKWYNLEGIIIDSQYLLKLQEKFPDCKGRFCGYGVSVDNFKNPVIDWSGNDTYIQKESINEDYGTFDNPDALFSNYPQKLSLLKRFLYRHFGRHIMNRRVDKIRNL
ncbi:transglutaminase-like domain-containing protein [Lachnoclostridium phytofermentans]|uniref:Transglutaminase domain protein n=1 Tax=Lachnoclostridium phytofermentans (strain ATCC 700394 / DSM 18823 / ISDg) TaxID=357809 RepID=A9KR87_LACP7|nr:transglutaminase-like domain-containing protein [Lachnoclostridium phytofermentans]ABX40555.1 transglutaminase domain protein [Lachnoclostridium phytofermentans ISDg]